MMFQQPKKMASIIISKMPGPEMEHEKEHSNEYFDYGYEACAEDIMEAIKSGNKALLVSALRNHHIMLDQELETEKEEGGEEVEPEVG